MSDNARLKEETIKQVRSILISAQHGLNVKEFNNDFRNIIGHELPFRKLGYSSMLELAHAWPDVIDIVHGNGGQVVLRGVADKSTRMMQRLVSRQKSPKKKSLMLPGGRQALGNQSRARPPIKCSVPPYLRTQIQELFVKLDKGLILSSLAEAFLWKYGCKLNYLKYSNSIFEFIDLFGDFLEKEETQGGGVRVYLRQSARAGSSHGAKTGCGSTSCVEGEVDNGAIPAVIKQNVKRVLSDKQKGIFAARFLVIYREMVGSELPFSRYGFGSVVEFASAIEDVVTIERPSKHGDWLLFDAAIKPKPGKSSPTKSGEESGLSTCAVDSRKDVHSLDFVAEKIWHVLASQPEGIELTNFLQKYAELTSEDLKVHNYGFSTLEDFIYSLTNLVKIVYKGQGTLLLFAADCQKMLQPDLLPGLIRKVVDPEPKFERNVPRDAVGPGLSFQSQKCPVEIQEYFEVFVSNIINPGRFWIQLRGCNTTLALEDLMDRLEEVYDSSLGDEYVMPSSLIAIGQVCVAIFPEDENWHRVIITGIPSLDFVEVYFADYGNSCCVHRENLRMLKNDFFRLPAQALEAKLSNIGPPDECGWSVAACNLMLKLCANKPLVAVLTSLQGNKLCVCLCDTSSDTDVHINDLLVNEQVAVFCPHQVKENLRNESRETLVTNRSSHQEESVAVNQLNQKVEQLSLGATQETTTQQQIRVHVKFIQLTKNKHMHIINLGGEAFVASGEISAFLWFTDLLRSMLRSKGMDVPKLVIAADDHPHLFKELQRFQITGVSDGKHVKSMITVYKLANIPEILIALDCKSQHLIAAVKKQALDFDPDDGYWT